MILIQVMYKHSCYTKYAYKGQKMTETSRKSQGRNESYFNSCMYFD